MQHTITGTTMPVLQIGLDPGEVIIAEPGEFSWMTDNIRLHTTTQTAGARGLFGAIGRALSGGGLFMTEYAATGGPGMVAFAAKMPGSIHQLDVPAGHSYMIHQGDSLNCCDHLCGSASVVLEMLDCPCG